MSNITPGGFNNKGATPGLLSSFASKVKPTNYGLPSYQAPAAVPNFMSAPKENVASHTQTTPDGTSIKTTYHKPTAGLINKTTVANSSQNNGSTPETKALQDQLVKEGYMTQDQVNTGYGIYGPKTTAAVAAKKAAEASKGASTGTTIPTVPVVDNSYKGLISGAAESARGNLNIGKSAKDIAAEYGVKIADVGNQGANYQVGALSTGTTPVGEGNAAINASATAAKQTALATGEAAALKGIEQQLTAQDQTTTGLINAGGLAAPKQQGYVLLDPTTGLPVQGGTTGSAAFQGGVTQGQEGAGENYTNMNVANTAAKGIKNQITNYLASNPNLNPSDLTFANSVNQWAEGKQLGDPTYQTLFNTLNEYISTLAPILGVGGNTTNLKTEIAQSMLNPQASGASISQVINNLETLADSKLANMASAGKGGGVVSSVPLAGTKVASPSAPVKIGNNSYSQDANGNWVVSK